MKTQLRLLAVAGWLLAACAAANPAAAWSDPSGRVARLSDSRGEISYSPAGEERWVEVLRNRPLTRGDRLWSARGARAEVQIGSAAVRMGPDTGLSILELDDRIAQFELTQGTLNIGVRRLFRGQTIEVATPTLAFVISRAGRYRIDVDADYEETTIVVWEGSGEALGEDGNFPLRAGDAVRFHSADMRDYRMFALPQSDPFDRWCLARDRRLGQSGSLRYVDDDLVGYADLDEYGSWRNERAYGNVWYPSQVRDDWAPYRDGHWVWQEPWGWTWVDDAPWGFAPSHYGRWVQVSGRWGWMPGPRNVRPVYAPALVAFVGGSGWSLSVNLGGRSRSRIGWFPLGPREVYLPSYQASREYFTQVNVSNTVVNNTVINNVYNNYASGEINVSQVNYANRSLAGAITAVPGEVFSHARPVGGAMIALDSRAATTGEILRLAPIAPSSASLVGLATATRSKPDEAVFQRPVYAHSPPPPAALPFEARQQQLQRNPGRAIQADNARDRGDSARQNVRVLANEANAPDVRATGSLRPDATPMTAGDKPAQLRPLDRNAERADPPVGRNRDEGRAADPSLPRDTASDLRPPQKPRDTAPPAEEAAAQAAARQRAAQQEQQQAEQRGRDDAERASKEREQAEQAAARQRAAQQEQQQAEQRGRDDAVRAGKEREQAEQAAARQRAAQQEQQQAEQRGLDEAERAGKERERAEQTAAHERAVELQQQQAEQRGRDNAAQPPAPAAPSTPEDGKRPPQQGPRKPPREGDAEDLDENGKPRKRDKDEH